MKKGFLILAIVFAVVMTLSAQNTSNANGQTNETPNVVDRLTHAIDPTAVVFGKTYAQWNAEWQQWAYSIPVSNHPLFDKGDCSVGQSGPVWFLGGKFCPNGETCDMANVVRSCTIPHGKAIYLPAFNAEDSVLEESVAENPGNPDAQQINFLRNVVDQFILTTKPYVMIDGVAVNNLAEKFTIRSNVFSFTMPDDNYLKALYGPGFDFPAGSYHPAVDAGQYVMIAPLSAGQHVIQFGGTNPYFTLNVKYFLNVTK